MHVTVNLSAEPPGVSLMAPDDCTAFDVIVHGSGGTDDLDRALAAAGVGRLEQGEARVTVAGVRRLASGSVGAGWEADFAAMLDYARGRGWLTEDGHAIRAHVEWH
jgi:hypothetical protein